LETEDIPATGELNSLKDNSFLAPVGTELGVIGSVILLVLVPYILYGTLPCSLLSNLELTLPFTPPPPAPSGNIFVLSESLPL
jgi:hypothetical protein